MGKNIYRNNANKTKYIRRCLLKSDYIKKQQLPNAFYLKYSISAPKNFSLIDNPVETTNFFNTIISFLLKAQDYILLRVDLSKITNITIDALMYLIAISVNINTTYRPRFNIIIPKEKWISNIILASGIDKFFDTGKIQKQKNDNYFSIEMGNKTDGEIASKMCDFTNRIIGTDIPFSSFLYDMLIEMMTNASQHAYNMNDKIINQWFIFAENSDDSIRYTFIDTGLGIPNTMSKYFYQVPEEEYFKDGSLKMILDRFSEHSITDADLILTGLKHGGFRTRTDKSYRGKGLPEIYDHFKIEMKTTNLKIISGDCLCEFDENDREKAIITNFDNKFLGTLFYWEIKK